MDHDNEVREVVYASEFQVALQRSGNGWRSPTS